MTRSHSPHLVHSPIFILKNRFSLSAFFYLHCDLLKHMLVVRGDKRRFVILIRRWA